MGDRCVVTIGNDQTKAKFKLNLELKFSRHFDNKTLQIRRHLKLDFGVCS